jgi:arylsulfatase A-like enzyme
MKIFIVIFDTLRKDHTGQIYGNSWIKTPNFDNFAKDTIVFKKAYPESLPTIPVRRSIHTGIRTFPFNHKLPDLRTDDMVQTPGWAPIPPYHIHLAEYMRKEGYVTSFITSTYHQFKPNMNFHLGFDQWNWIRGHETDKYRVKYREGKSKLKKLLKEYASDKDHQAAVYQKHFLNPYLGNVQERSKEEDYFPAQTFNKAIEFVKDTESFKKVCCVIDEFDPHEPWDPPEKYLNMYVDKNFNGKKTIQPAYSTNLNYLTKEELKYMRASYAGEVTLCDTWFGFFIEELKKMNIYDDSLIFLISDHGHSIGEHDATGKIPSHLYPELVDIPFMIKPPHKFKGPKLIEKTYVYNHDILPTIFGFLQKKKLDAFEGIDLSVFVEEKDQLIEDRNYVTCGFGAYTLYKDDSYALITSNDKSYQKLFDMTKDEDWNIDIAKSNPDVCNELYEKIKHDAKDDLLIKDVSKFKDVLDWYRESNII